MKIFRLEKMSIPTALLLSACIIGLSIFLTVWVFFGGDGNRQKLFMEKAMPQKNTPTPMTPEQIKKIQEQRAAQIEAQKQKVATSTEE